MEKPSPSYDISPRFALQHTRDHSEKNERYYDRMATRGIPVLRDNDGEEHKPVWRGDHSFSSDAATYSLIHFIEPEVKREHPDWGNTQIHEHAVERFHKRLAQDLSSERRENAHEESVVRWRPVTSVDGFVELATEYGGTTVTLSELWEHTKEYAAFVGNPAAYNSEEHRAQLLMQDKLMNGSSNGFVSVLSHPDAIRYVQVWEKSENGDVLSHHVDLYAATGKDFSQQEATELIQHLSDFHGQRTETGVPDAEHTYAHFFVTKGVVLTDDIRTIAIAQSVSVDTLSHARETVDVQRQHISVGQVVITDVAEGARQIGKHLRDQIEEKIREIQRRTTSPDAVSFPAKPGAKEGQKAAVGAPVLKGRTEKEKEITARSRHTPDAAGQKPEMMSLLTDWWISHTMLRYVSLVPVAPEAALYWFTLPAVVDTQKPQVEKKPVKVKSPGNEPVRQVTVRHSVSDIWKSFVVRMKETIASRTKRTVVTEKNTRIKQHGGAPVTASEGGVGPDVRTRQSEISGVSTWYEVLHTLSRFMGEGDESRVIGAYKENARADVHDGMGGLADRRDERSVSVGRFMFALVLWWFFQPVVSDGAQAAKLKDGLAAGGGKQKHDPVREENNPHQQEGTPWMLLAIIWYLSMIRESAMTGAQPTAQKQGVRAKRKRKTARLPQHGIIFAFAS